MWCALIGEYFSHGQPYVLHLSSMVEKLLTLWGVWVGGGEGEGGIFFLNWPSCLLLSRTTEVLHSHIHLSCNHTPFPPSHLSLCGVTPLPGRTIVHPGSLHIVHWRHLHKLTALCWTKVPANKNTESLTHNTQTPSHVVECFLWNSKWAKEEKWYKDQKILHSLTWHHKLWHMLHLPWHPSHVPWEGNLIVNCCWLIFH